MNRKPPFSISSATPSEGLLERIVHTIQERQYRARLWRIRVFAVTAALSIVALIPSSVAMMRAFKVSHFGTYISVIFSDGGVLASYWKDIATSLIESLPVISITVALALVGILLWSVSNMVRFMNNTRFFRAV